jgi:hypothetical protein
VCAFALNKQPSCLCRHLPRALLTSLVTTQLLSLSAKRGFSAATNHHPIYSLPYDGIVYRVMHGIIFVDF